MASLQQEILQTLTGTAPQGRALVASGPLSRIGPSLQLALAAGGKLKLSPPLDDKTAAKLKHLCTEQSPGVWELGAKSFTITNQRVQPLPDG